VRAPLSWLCDFAPFDVDPLELAATFDDLGLVVEGVERVGEGLGDVVVAEVVGIDPIAGADRIRKVTVDAGGDPVEVVCGAWNFEVGDVVTLAPVGSTLPNGFEVGARKMKGVRSNGMLCSGAELGLSDDASGLLVLGRGGSPGSPEAGTALAEALGIARDVVFDLGIETNRPDALSMAGVARDAAARLSRPFSLIGTEVTETTTPTEQMASVVVEAPALAPRFAARALFDVEVGPSPPWLARRLVLAGLRAINSVVDASNYVMLEIGQPTHPYDLDRLAGGGIVVRGARPDEQVVTLDGQTRRLGVELATGGRAEDCLICDGNGEPIGIAGIMGGSSTEISTGTSRVLLEAAYFDPMAIARTSKRLGLRTEASVRFERGCDPKAIDRALERVAVLVAAGEESAGPSDAGSGSRRASVANGLIDVRSAPIEARTVALRTDRVNTILGTDLDDEAVRRYLEPIGFAVAARREGLQDVEVPTFRPDTTREIDLIEEVARHHGYSAIERRVPIISQVGGLTPRQRERRLLRELLAGLGATEAWTKTLVAPGADEATGLSGSPLVVDNPLAKEESVLRRRLLPGLLGALSYNLARRNESIAFFEMGHVFWPPASGERLPEEREHLAVLLARPGDGAASAVSTWRAFAHHLRLLPVEMLADSLPGLHPTRAARLTASGVDLGSVGEVDPEVLVAHGIDDQVTAVGYLELDLDHLLSAERRTEVVPAPSRFPSSDVDLAFVVADRVAAAAVEEALRLAGGDILEGLKLIDVYRGAPLAAGERNLTFRLRFCASDRTLTDAETAEARQRCIDAVEDTLPAQLRS
jgi:phenylalanyl-tRNA synthetase beta chain